MLLNTFSLERRLDRALTEGQQRNGQLQEHLSQQLSQSLSTAVCNRLERTVREEMKKTVPQCEWCYLGFEGGSLQLSLWGLKASCLKVLALYEVGVRLCEDYSLHFKLLWVSL